MSIDKKSLPVILATIKVHKKAYVTTMNELLLQLATKKDRPSQALKTRIITANDLFERLEKALVFIDNGVEDYE